jgi:hypothetical protein
MNGGNHTTLLIRFVVCFLASRALAQSISAHPATQPSAAETIGGGLVAEPAVGPPASFEIGGPNLVLVKNWHFGKDGTVRNYDDMDRHFLYHDQFNTIGNGTNYGAITVAHNAASAIGNQPIEGIDCPPVREFTDDSLKTYLTGLDGATLCKPNAHNAGCGSFMARWKLPKAGALPAREIVWETRVRYVTPPYFWFAIWAAGDKWKGDSLGAQGAEQDLVESFGYDNGQNFTNFDGRFWHSNSVATPAKDTVEYADWGKAMAKQGIKSFDASQFHIWTWQYKTDGSYAMYLDGIKVQSGSNYYWTYGNKAADEPIDMFFLFDGTWGHNQIASVNHSVKAAEFVGKYYEWNYSRVYLGGDAVK